MNIDGMGERNCGMYDLYKQTVKDTPGSMAWSKMNRTEKLKAVAIMTFFPFIVLYCFFSVVCKKDNRADK